jgi:hypothetical protein
MAKAEATVEELVSMIERGELRLPEMQRRYVWRSTRVRDLLDSLYRGYPSGAILVWETDEQVPLRDFAVSQQSNAFQSTRLLLDGQQRLTSLSAVIRGEPVEVRGRKKPIELLFNLEHPDQLSLVTEVNEDSEDDFEDEDPDSSAEELEQRFRRMTFVVASRQLEMSSCWVKVSDVFKTTSDAPFLERAGVEKLSDPRCEKYTQRLARLRGIRKYSYRMDILERSLSYDEVTEIFVRVNSLGAKLRSSDLALAQITARWRGALAVFQKAQAACDKSGFPLDLGVYLRNLVVFATGQCRFLTVGTLSLDQLRHAWDQSIRAMEFALNFVKNNVGIESPALLTSPFLLIALGYYGHRYNYQLDSADAENLRYWALVANGKGRYSRGSTETLLDQDLSTPKDDGTAIDLVERLRLQLGVLEVLPQELEGRDRRSAFFKTMFMAFRAAGAKDWQSKLSIALDHSGTTHQLQFHHIFPKASLKHHYTTREADDIANLAFISGRTNRRISSKSAGQYLPGVFKECPESLTLQCIPIDPELWKLENYKAFLAERRRLITRRLNEFLRGDSVHR